MENVLGYIYVGLSSVPLKETELEFSLKVNLLCFFILTHKTFRF